MTAYSQFTKENEPLRLPDFIIIGAMKAGTTSLFRWLDMHPDCALPKTKEIRFFSREENWARGLRWYTRFFKMIPGGKTTGEASPQYTDPRISATVAERMSTTVPSARLLLILRDPFARTRSHYCNAVQKNRESRTFTDVISDSREDIVQRSLYWKALKPYTEKFSREQICVVTFEDLFSPPHNGWSDILNFLDLPSHPPPALAYNVTSNKRQLSRLLDALASRGCLDKLDWMPQVVRRVGKASLTGNTAAFRTLLATANAQIPEDVRRMINEDTARLQRWLGNSKPLWE